MIKKYLIHICLLLSLLCQPILASADELVDMAQKMYPNDNVQAINRPHSSLLLTEIRAMFFGKTISMKSEILPA